MTKEVCKSDENKRGQTHIRMTLSSFTSIRFFLRFFLFLLFHLCRNIRITYTYIYIYIYVRRNETLCRAKTHTRDFDKLFFFLSSLKFTYLAFIIIIAVVCFCCCYYFSPLLFLRSEIALKYNFFFSPFLCLQMFFQSYYNEQRTPA